MVSLAARIFRFYLVWIRRSLIQSLTAHNMREHIQAQYIRSQSFSPPLSLGPDISIERVHHYELVAQIARDTGLDVLVPIYPLIPRPAANAVQVVAGLHKIVTQIKQPIVSIAGDSAGGNLAMLLAQHLVRVKSDLISRVRSLVLISPALDCTMSHPETKRLVPDDP
ncbi:alpha beta-hydrolase [Fusarium agapanthi]|uniref:Alpha beta-hydrolase n=1 Tax=Fusarium agapanthi TaxID=1803897 RepID=A0A9P5AXM7_9HYPO|nr:alpha beta-hydrolase [Fusarium agapanthi]